MRQDPWIPQEPTFRPQPRQPRQDGGHSPDVQCAHQLINQEINDWNLELLERLFDPATIANIK